MLVSVAFLSTIFVSASGTVSQDCAYVSIANKTHSLIITSDPQVVFLGLEWSK